MSVALAADNEPVKPGVVLGWCLSHFVHLDEANACLHCAPVRYSPLTFRVAELVITMAAPSRVHKLASEVLNHKGQYSEDKGR